MTSLVVGLITGAIVAFLGVYPILVTLGTMTAVKGIAVYTTGGGVIGGFPPAILFLGNGILLGVPVPMILFILCAIAVAVIMSHAPFAVAVRLIGSNEKATRYSGVATDWMLVGVYVLSSLLCWVAAVVMMARFNSASAGYAESYLLITILAAVLGGDPGTTNSMERVTGFTNAAKEGGLNVVASQPANWNRKKADELARNILQSDCNLKAIFVANDDMALGVVRAVQATGATGKIIVVSVDGTPDAIDALKQGLLTGTVAQYPDAMAYLAIETLVKTLNRETVPEKIYSPVKLITKDNVLDAGKYYKDELDLSSSQ